jgi:hypothetical protein
MGEIASEKTCPACKQTLSREMFSTRKSGALQSYCKACSSAKGREWAKANRARATDNAKAWENAMREKGTLTKYKPSENAIKAQSERNKKRYWAEPEKARSARRAYYLTNKDAEAKRYKDWASANRHKRTASQMLRDASKKNATPPWSKADDIARVYAVCDRVTKRTGITHHVDHIVPLVSDKVCGLHVFHNLAVVTAKENQSKSNRMWPGMFNE